MQQDYLIFVINDGQVHWTVLVWHWFGMNITHACTNVDHIRF